MLMDSKLSENVVFLGFNQDCGKKICHEQNRFKNKTLFFNKLECFMCGLETGYRIYNTEPLKENARDGCLFASFFLIIMISYNYK
jgi:hypothetical protein